MTGLDTFDLQRFVAAQASTYAQVVSELGTGEKRSHWMWFIFPQVRGLGSSSMAQRYAISGLPEAQAYLEHPLLGPRLRECTALVNVGGNRTLDQIFGYPDDLKFHSSMTLFALADGSPGNAFRAALDQHCGGRSDARTLALLRATAQVGQTAEPA